MTAPFDPEAEARAMRDAFIASNDGIAEWFDEHAADALRRAYEAGAADMRERAAHECDNEQRLYLEHAEVMDAGGHRHGATADTHAALGCKAAAKLVRALSPSEPR